MQAETYEMSLGVEAGDLLRASFVDMKGLLVPKDWERTAAQNMVSVWITDCASTQQALIKQVMGAITDKRLGIELAGLRQAIWRTKGQRIGDPRLSENMPGPEEATDIVYWVDTDVMIADALTKQMSPEKLIEALQNNFMDLIQPTESLQKKRVKQEQRSKATAGKSKEETTSTETGP